MPQLKSPAARPVAATRPVVVLRVAARRPAQGGRSQVGMALMEALIAILIFSFGVLGLIGLEASAINFSVDSEDRNRAALFASEVVSAMWLAGSVDVVNNAQLAAQNTVWQGATGGISDATKAGMTNGTLTYAPVTSITNAAGTVIATDITITWKPPARASTAAASKLTTRVILP
jgi:type IV pilus assembly protein PilV